MPQAAQIIDFATFRNRREAAKAAQAHGSAMAPMMPALGMPAFAGPVFWMPVWVFVSPIPAPASA